MAGSKRVNSGAKTKPVNNYGKYDELIRFLRENPDIEKTVLKLMKYRKEIKYPTVQTLARRILKALRSKHRRVLLAAINYCNS